jgi:hypothetical protein
MSLEAGNRRKSAVILAVTAGYFFSLKKIMRENLSSIRPKKNICVFTVTCQKNLGSVGRH